MIKGLIFDLGGTVVTDRGLSFMNGFTPLYNYFEKKNFSIEEYKAYLKEVKEQTINVRTTFDFSMLQLVHLLELHFQDKIMLEPSEIEELYSKSCEIDELCEGITDFLEKCKQNDIKMGILSNTILSSNELKRRLKCLGVLDYFDFVIASSDCLVRKPSKLFMDLGIDAIDLEKGDIAYVGNMYEFDVKCANSANINCMFYNRFHKGEYKYDDLNIKVYEFDDYKALSEVDLCQIF